MGLLIGMLLLVGFVVGIFVVVGRVILGAQRAVQGVAAEIRAGAIPGIVQWHPSLLAQLSCDWIGASHYTRGGFGNNDSAGGKIVATSLRAPALAFVCETKDRGNAGTIDLVTSSVRLSGRIDRGALVIGSLGTLFLQNGALVDPMGQTIGQYQRDHAETFCPVWFRGRCIAAIHRHGDSHTALPAAPRPLFAALDIRSAEEEAWLLVLAVVELGSFGVRREHEGMRTRGLASASVP